jgi:hypothetical protein
MRRQERLQVLSVPTVEADITRIRDGIILPLLTNPSLTTVRCVRLVVSGSLVTMHTVLDTNICEKKNH